MYKIIGADQQQYGPVSGELIRQWIADGRINSQTLMLAEGATEWKPASSFPEFAALLPATPVTASATPPPVGTPVPGTVVGGPAPTIPNYLVQSILVTLCCCLPAGVVAIIYAAQVQSKVAAGDITGAENASAKARMWCWISLAAGLVVGGLYGLASFMGAMHNFGNF